MVAFYHIGYVLSLQYSSDVSVIWAQIQQHIP